jgi:hypothetical protein
VRKSNRRKHDAGYLLEWRKEDVIGQSEPSIIIRPCRYQSFAVFAPIIPPFLKKQTTLQYRVPWAVNNRVIEKVRSTITTKQAPLNNTIHTQNNIDEGSVSAFNDSATRQTSMRTYSVRKKVYTHNDARLVYFDHQSILCSDPKNRMITVQHFHSRTNPVKWIVGSQAGIKNNYPWLRSTPSTVYGRPPQHVELIIRTYMLFAKANIPSA